MCNKFKSNSNGDTDQVNYGELEYMYTTLKRTIIDKIEVPLTVFTYNDFCEAILPSLVKRVDKKGKF
jgi:hypothetical protein